MYVNSIQYKDAVFVLDRRDYDLVGYLLLDSANEVISRLDLLCEYRDIQLESYDLLPERFVNYIRLRYRYVNILVTYCDGWLLDESI